MFELLNRSQIDLSKYLDLMNNSEHSLIYSDIDFLDSISKYTNSQLFFVVESNCEGYVNVLPFCIYFGELGPVINSLPFFGSNGGIISRKKGVVKPNLILDVLFDFAKSNDCISITIIESPFQPLHPDAHQRFKFRDSRIGLFNNFEPGTTAEDLIKSFQDPRPRNIRKAEKHGITIVESRSDESIMFLAQTHFENISSIGGMPKTYDFFLKFFQDFPETKWIVLDAHFQEERIASLLLLYNHNVIEYFTPATVERYRSLQAQTLLIFKGMLFAISKGIKKWNWGGTWHSQKGVYDFKRKWGASELDYSYFCAVLDDSILSRSARELQQLYPFFYVVPFGELEV